MIVQLRGTVVESTLNSVVIDVSGVGFELGVAGSTAAALPPVGAETLLFVRMVVRDESSRLRAANSAAIASKSSMKSRIKYGSCPFMLPPQAYFQVCLELDGVVFCFHEFKNASHATFSAKAALLDAAERSCRIGH